MISNVFDHLIKAKLRATLQISDDLKNTEIGFIPRDWKLLKLGSVSDFRTGPFGSALHKSDYTADGIPVINPMHIVDGKIRPTATMTITLEARNKLSEYQLKPGNIIIGRRGEMGRAAVVTERESGWLCGTGSLIIRCSASIVPEFLRRVLSSHRAVSDIEETSVGSTMINLNQATLANLLVQLPSLDEQRAIANALSDVDDLITALDKLISKKRAIKQATMQQLLTGRTRLPGFSGEWELYRLGDVSDIRTGKKNNDDKVADGQYPFFVRSQHVEKIDTYSFEGEAILIPGEGGIGSIYHYIDGRFDFHQRVYKISNFSAEMNGKFIYYSLMQTFSNHAMKNSVKATVDSLRLPTFIDFEFVAPAHSEQTAIVSVLTSMESELTALDARRDKMRLIKQGMMQQLLTGRIRLVDSEQEL